MQEITVTPTVSTLAALKATRNQFGIWFLIVWAIALCASGMIQVITYAGLVRDSAFPDAFLPGLAISLFSRIFMAGVLWYYAGRVEMPANGRALSALSGFVPLMAWVGVYAVAGYTPPHLREEQEAEDIRDTSFPAWVVPTIPPIIVFGILTLMNPKYMAQLFLGPPIGVTIPATPIPCGWPILLIAFLLVALADVAVWLAYNRKLVRGGWMFLLIFQVLVFFESPVVWIMLLGPAAVQMYKQFSGNGSP
jgi:hypothetical protein